MPNYQNGKIYCIRSFKTDDIYIGSTTQPLCKRIDQHRRAYKCWINGTKTYISSVELIKHGDAYIELINKYPCNSKEELCKEEGKYQREMECVNKSISGRTREQWIEDNPNYQKDYYENHKDKKKEYTKKWKKNNPDKVKEYRKKSFEKDNERCKEFYKNNKQRILKKAKEKYTCVCGNTLNIGHKARHERSQKHIRFIEAQS